MTMQPRSSASLDSTEILTIRFVGDPVGADLLAFFLRDEGFVVESEPPRAEQPYVGEVSVCTTIKVSLELAEYLTPNAIREGVEKAIDKVIQRTPRVEIQIDDES